MSATSDFYLAQATKCAADAADATLMQVRERNLRSAAAWREMAEKLLRMERARADKERAVEAARLAAANDGAAHTG